MQVLYNIKGYTLSRQCFGVIIVIPFVHRPRGLLKKAHTYTYGNLLFKNRVSLNKDLNSHSEPSICRTHVKLCMKTSTNGRYANELYSD